MGWVVIMGVLCLCFVRGGSYLLPGDVIPRHYDIRLLYDVDPITKYPFYGVVDISLTVAKPTSKIVLHAQDYDVSEDKITLNGSSEWVEGHPGVSKVALDNTLNFLIVEVDKQLQTDQNYTLTIPFNGNLKRGLLGVYISTYVDKKTNEKEFIIATHFEPISARLGFPCFDEPIYKATFRMVVGHHRDYTAVSNMPLEKSVDDNALETYWPWDIVGATFKKEQSRFVWAHFETSLPMSTYLVAFVVVRFTYVESPAGLSNTRFKIWARKDAIDQAQYASTIGPKVLSHFEKWFDVPFPLPKQDMIAIPDFSAGAMENWGMITYRETALLYDKQQSSFTNKEWVAETIAHELAHQWFGNLVTMKWWSDLWLNEGFATYAASVGVDAVEPEWEADRNYAVDGIMLVLDLDALESSHPVSVPIDDPRRIPEIFDAISYSKGAALIRMLVAFLGEAVFKEAVHNYLIKYSYKNAEQDDLWQELTEVAMKHNALSRDVTVKRVMDTWSTQTGYPLLTVERDYSANTLNVSQERYLALAGKAGAGSWWVPVNILCQSDKELVAQLQWLADDEGVTDVHQFQHRSEKDQWLMLNPAMIAPYRVNYDARNWQRLTAALKLKHASLPALGRVQLLSDAFELAWTNRLDYEITLDLASYLRREQEYLPLDTGLRALAKIENVLKRLPEYGAFQKYGSKLVRDTYRKIGGLSSKKIMNRDNLNSVKFQVLTSTWACRMTVPGCQENAIELFQTWMDTANPDENNPIPLDLRRTVCCVAVARGSLRHWLFALQRKQNANSAATRNTLLVALTCTREVWILRQYLEWTVTNGKEVRHQDSATVIAHIIRSSVGFYVAKDFIYNRIADIHAAFSSQRHRIGDLIKILLGQFTAQPELDQFLVWRDMNAKYLEDAKLAVEQAVEGARVNIAWLSNNKELVVDKLAEFSNEYKSDLPYFRVFPTGAHLRAQSLASTARRLQAACVTSFLCLLRMC